MTRANGRIRLRARVHLNGEELAADLRAEADRLHDEMRRLQDQADELLNAADDLDPPPAAPGDCGSRASNIALSRT
jgi:hypothetical protein